MRGPPNSPQSGGDTQTPRQRLPLAQRYRPPLKARRRLPLVARGFHRVTLHLFATLYRLFINSLPWMKIKKQVIFFFPQHVLNNRIPTGRQSWIIQLPWALKFGVPEGSTPGLYPTCSLQCCCGLGTGACDSAAGGHPGEPAPRPCWENFVPADGCLALRTGATQPQGSSVSAQRPLFTLEVCPAGTNLQNFHSQQSCH